MAQNFNMSLNARYTDLNDAVFIDDLNEEEPQTYPIFLFKN